MLWGQVLVKRRWFSQVWWHTFWADEEITAEAEVLQYWLVPAAESQVSRSVTGASSWRMFVSWWYCFYILFSVHWNFFSKKVGGTEIVYLLKSVNPFTCWITLYHSLWVFSSPRNLCLHVHSHQVQTSKSRLTLTRQVGDPDHRYGAHPHFSGASSIQPQLPLQQSMLIGLPSQCVTVLWAAPASYYSNHKNISWV